MSITTADAMLGYCNGDPAAFRALYDACAPRLLGYLKRLCGDAAQANDLLQLTFLKLHQRRDLYVRGADPLPWLYTIAQRTFIDAHRSRQRARVVPNDPSDDRTELPEIAVGLRGTPLDDEPVERPDAPEPRELAAALDRLPAQQRQALVLTKLEGRTMAEAAALLGTTPGAVKLRAHRAYESLRRYLGRDARA